VSFASFSLHWSGSTPTSALALLCDSKNSLAAGGRGGGAVGSGVVATGLAAVDETRSRDRVAREKRGK